MNAYSPHFGILLLYVTKTTLSIPTNCSFFTGGGMRRARCYGDSVACGSRVLAGLARHNVHPRVLERGIDVCRMTRSISNKNSNMLFEQVSFCATRLSMFYALPLQRKSFNRTRALLTGMVYSEPPDVSAPQQIVGITLLSSVPLVFRSRFFLCTSFDIFAYCALSPGRK